MRKKIDPLFALSVLVLVLGVFALACSWVPFRSQCSGSNNVARADAVASVTPENFSWGVDSNNAVVHIRGNPVICATAVPVYSLYESLYGVVNINLTLGSTSFGRLSVSVDFAEEDNGITGVPGKICMAWFNPSSMPQEVYSLSWSVQSAYIGDANNWAAMNNYVFRFNTLNSFSVYSVPVINASLSLQDLYWSVDYSGIESGTQAQWVALLDAFLRPSYDSAVYALSGALSGQIEQLEIEKADLLNQLNSLQKKYQDLLYDYSLVAAAGTSIVQWGTTFKFSPVFGETSLPADNTVFYEGYTKFGSGVKTLGNEVFYDVSASLNTEKKAWYPSSLSAGKYVCFGLPFNYVMTPNVTATYVFSTPVATKMMLGVYDSERKTIYFRAFLNNVTNVSFSAFDYRTSNSNDRIVFYGLVDELPAVATDFLVPTAVDTLHITISAGQNGYDAGFDAGVKSVKSQYESQLEAVKENARQKGFAEAEAMFNSGDADYSFFGLISAVIDAPIKAMRGLLNFDILGVNMFAFVTSLFSLAVVLMIVKLLLGTRDVV